MFEQLRDDFCPESAKRRAFLDSQQALCIRHRGNQRREIDGRERRGTYDVPEYFVIVHELRQRLLSEHQAIAISEDSECWRVTRRLNADSWEAFVRLLDHIAFRARRRIGDGIQHLVFYHESWFW